MNKNSGLLYVYTGNGKGKTSAAIGGVIRMLGNKGHVGFFQFLKGQSKSNEREFFKELGDRIDNQVFGVGFFRKKEQRQKQQKAALKGLNVVKEAIFSEKFDLIVIDEINVALEMKLLDLDEVIDILGKRSNTHLIITGRYAKNEIIEIADLVTEMKEIKHPHKKGIKPVKGIDC